ncbi:hypothetical protein RRG08_056410 [Elysia crispata]|uniref:Uncharacterized protein n=1 Tax=Elysia crispata TaxID=231223 RepID=A0AAE0Z045_9GAST|nr:hypothetical protein RRG08_056410 [Elysia crispata]
MSSMLEGFSSSGLEACKGFVDRVRCSWLGEAKKTSGFRSFLLFVCALSWMLSRPSLLGFPPGILCHCSDKNHFAKGGKSSTEHFTKGGKPSSEDFAKGGKPRINCAMVRGIAGRDMG